MKKIISIIKKVLCIALFILTNAYCVWLGYSIYKSYFPTATPSSCPPGAFCEPVNRMKFMIEHRYIIISLFTLMVHEFGTYGLLLALNKVRLKWFVLSIIALLAFFISVFCCIAIASN